MRAAMRAVMRRRRPGLPLQSQPPDPAPRLAACAACQHYDKQSDRCRLCGCADQMTRRSASPWGSCPAGRWPPPTVATASGPANR